MALVLLQGKVLPEVLTKFKEAQQNSESETFNQFVEELLEAYLNPKTKPVEVIRPSAEQLQEIELKENEIGLLKSAYSLLEERTEELTRLNAQLETSNAILEQSINQPAPALEKNQVLLTIPPIMSIVLDFEKEVAKKKSGKDFTIGDLLLNNFWESIVNGVSYPFRIWSRQELANLTKDVKEAIQ